MQLAAGRFVMDQRDYLVVNAHDVTESERTRLQHTAILERASIGIAFTRDGRFIDANPYFARMFGWETGSLRGQPGAVVWANADDYREIGELAGPLLSAGKPFEIERRMRRSDDTSFWCRLLAQAVDAADPARGGTIWIAEDVTERRRLDDALAAARDAAEAASQAKSAFLANTSHEIRTPLNGLLGLARLAMREDLGPARRQEYLGQILDSAQSLAGIMSDILDVSKIEAGRLSLEDMPFDLHDTLRAAHHAYHSLAEVKGLAMPLLIDERLPATVRGDPVRVRQILSNFITNALKFTERGQVRIEAAPAAPAENTEAHDLARLARSRVLMVEDNPVNMMIAVAMLEQWGVRVAQAVDGRMAVAAVHQAVNAGDPFHAVVMDVQMPVMSGHEAARELRSHYAPKDLPIIALTAAALVSERAEALACGMDDFLTKPIDSIKLRATLAQHLGARVS